MKKSLKKLIAGIGALSFCAVASVGVADAAWEPKKPVEVEIAKQTLEQLSEDSIARRRARDREDAEGEASCSGAA